MPRGDLVVGAAIVAVSLVWCLVMYSAITRIHADEPSVAYSRHQTE